jgi:hypothetical protein
LVIDQIHTDIDHRVDDRRAPPATRRPPPVFRV